jgi:hypothetical protein
MDFMELIGAAQEWSCYPIAGEHVAEKIGDKTNV